MPPRVSERTAFAGASVTTFLGGLGLLGWVTPWRGLASMVLASIPMAPHTALAFLLLGGTLMLEARRRSPRLTTAVSSLVLILTGLELASFAAGLPPTLDALLVPDPDMFGGVPTGRMSPWTAFGLVLASLSLLFTGHAGRHRALGAAAGSLALAVCLLGVVVTLGYLFRAPLLYGSPVVPMAFPTALAAGCLGLALVGVAPRDSAPLRLFTGSSARAKLLRAFLPVAPAIVVGELVFAQVKGLNPALHVALTALLSASVVAALVSYAAHGVSRELDRAQAEREGSRRDADRLAAIVQSSSDAIYARSLDGTIVAWNASAMRLFGYSQDEALGRSAKLLLPPGAEDELLGRIRAGERMDHEETNRVRKDGSPVLVSLSESPLRDAEGNVVGVSVIARDVSEQRRAEKQLERRLLESEEEYRLLFDSNPHPMWVFDVETLAFLAVNDAAVRLYGYSRDEFLGMTIKDIRPLGEVPALLEYLVTIPDSPSLPATQVKHRKKDGSLLEVAGSSNPIDFHGKRARLVLADDVTEKRGLEAQLLQAQKMEAVGRLAGGVAHDFNNALGVILGYTELLMRHADEAQLGKLGQILKATQRAAGLTRQLLAFSRKQIVDAKVLDLNALLSELEIMLGRLIGEDIDLAIVPGADLGQVKADPVQLEQVVMNLCVNARDAMRDGGLLRIETANAELDAGHAARHEPIAPGRYVMLAVSDTGCGIEPEVLSKIFEPFFTTKELGKGTGLGLSMVYGIVQQAGGHVWVYSEPGRGTTFKIYLPRVDQPAVAPEVHEASMPAKGWETILLVEDEGALRALAREILEEHGYRVIEAPGAKEAIEIAHRHPEPIHLLLTDVVMPGMNGRALAESLVVARPELRVLYMSGYTDDVIAHRGVLASGTLLLTKPFTALALLGRVRAALGERGRGENA